VDRHFVWFDLNRQQGDPVLAQSFPLLGDETLVVRRLESRSQGFQQLLQSRQFLLEVGRGVASWLVRSVAVSIIVQVQIAATDSVFVEIDSIRATHEHEPSAPRGTQPILQRFPIRFHALYPLIAAPLSAAHWSASTSG